MRNKVANELLERMIRLDYRVERLEWALAEISKVLRQSKEESSDD